MFNLLKTSLKIASSLPPPFSDPSQEIVQLENDFPIKQARKLAKSDAERDHKMDTVESKAEYESDDDDYDDDDEEEDEEEEEEEEEESNQHIFGGEGTEEGSSSHFVKLHSSHIVDQIIGPLILLFSNLCRTPTSKELFKPFVPVLVQLVCSKCWPLIVDSLISLARLVEAGNGYTQDMCHKPLFETLIGLLKMKDRVYQSSAVIFLSAVMYADAPELSELALNSGSIPTVVALLDDDRLALLSETLSIITNSVLSEECRREALAAGVAQKLSHILRKSQTLAIKKETVLCVHNIACGSAFCVSSLVEASVHVELIRMLNCPDEDTVKKCLKILFRSLRFGEKIAKEVERIVESNSEDEGIDDETITDGTAGKMEVEADEMAEAKKSLSLLADLRNDNTSSSPSSDIYRILKHYNFNIVLQSLDENNIRPILKYLQTNGTDSVKQMSEKLWDIFFKPIEDSED
ncbi:uncharacterized protein MONOS_4491 [Monocercomonoides exilis]|uniref:uncharacterized protein n=1 Tax=Monocercomonoides exilis TaxID=2049356 RepID=UPI00355A5C5A|nr:hypothetical protein MONOS_4491 [Monocercomonoides exilis]|eukprot:MONOS_4491.1-p1 / transcript=MONOS_4491.1 / gene=MONOS_4491 / organism=Monocercomonoides_exilis_PA203 / gene_product=unspecified product / transcript_product=unspecified product / location=Mono_scaffold00120:41179-42771(-) / protein_length=463 / sequence_SO=supercontig / SO=protein_coding / is_pseudo=false